jgi:hypothetical protein
MISSADFTVSLLGAVGRFSTANRTPGGASAAGRSEADGIVSGRSHDRQRAVFMSATGQLHGRLRAVSRVRCQTIAAYPQIVITPLKIHNKSPARGASLSWARRLTSEMSAEVDEGARESADACSEHGLVPAPERRTTEDVAHGLGVRRHKRDHQRRWSSR